jgi:hypothetical protein
MEPAPNAGASAVPAVLGGGTVVAKKGFCVGTCDWQPVSANSANSGQRLQSIANSFFSRRRGRGGRP